MFTPDRGQLYRVCYISNINIPDELCYFCISLLVFKMFKYFLYSFTKYIPYRKTSQICNVLPKVRLSTPSVITCQRQIHSISSQLGNRNVSLFKTILSFSILGLLGGKEEKLDPESEMIMTMKRAILCTQRGQFTKAEQILHIALTMAQKQNNELAITYIYDLMANLAMEREEYGKAKKLFVNVLQRLLKNGVKEEDLRIIHINIKLARIQMELNVSEEAALGFQWSLEHLKRRNLHTDQDALLLYGITNDYYAQLLREMGKYSEAVACVQEAYDICVKVEGSTSVQAVRLLNDLATVCWLNEQYNTAEGHLRTALVQSMDLPDKDYLGIIKTNLGFLLIHRGLMTEAHIHCKEAWHIASKNKDNVTLVQANECLDKLRKLKHYKK